VIGSKLAFLCSTCGAIAITVVRAAGAVPRETRCLAPRCRAGRMAFRGAVDLQLRADFQWVRLTRGALRRARRDGNRELLAQDARGELSLVPWPREWSKGATESFSKVWARVVPEVQAKAKESGTSSAPEHVNDASQDPAPVALGAPDVPGGTPARVDASSESQAEDAPLSDQPAVESPGSNQGTVSGRDRFGAP